MVVGGRERREGGRKVVREVVAAAVDEGGKWKKGDGWLAKWDFGRSPRPWEYERKRRGKDGGNGTLKQRDVDRWMIMGFFFPS